VLTADFRVDSLVAGCAVAGHCLVAGSRASVQDVGGSDALLAARLAAGDDLALAEVFDRLASAVYGGAFRVLGDDAAAQDVVQDVFVELWRYPGRYDPAAGKLRTYLIVLARHRAVDLVRSELRRVARQERSYRLAPGQPGTSPCEEEVVASEAAAAVRAAIRLLPDSQRRIVELAYFGGLTCREAARAAGIPEGTAKSRLRLALARHGDHAGPSVAGVVMTAGERGQALPAGLRERVLAASLRARAAGRPEPAAPEISPAEAFIRTADALYAMLCALNDEDWRRPALRGLDVQGLVGHLTGVEEDVHRCLAGDPEVAGASHVESTQPAAARQAGRPPAQTRAEWRRAAGRTIDLVHAAGDLRAEVAVHDMRLPLGTLLVVRAFELWIHDNDIRQAAALPPSVPDASTLRLMTEAAARLLPYAAARVGLREPTAVHLVLTGPGGGTWDLLMGQSPPAPAAVGIVTGAVGFCRLVANRVPPPGSICTSPGIRAAPPRCWLRLRRSRWTDPGGHVRPEFWGGNHPGPHRRSGLAAYVGGDALVW
jgi:RNA polymerase sigma factor (sigma-70 family)